LRYHDDPHSTMLRSIGLPELIVLLMVSGLFIVPAVFYLLTLQNALQRCSPSSRTLAPGLVWVMLIPLVNLIWHFVVVVKISQSLHNEFVRRERENAEPHPGLKLGLAMCSASVLAAIPLRSAWWLFTILGTGLWIAYWIVMSKYSRSLTVPV